MGYGYTPVNTRMRVRVQYLYAYLPRTNSRCTSVSVPGASARSVQHSYPYPELVYVLYACVTIPGARVCPCKPTRVRVQVQGKHSYIYPELVRVLPVPRTSENCKTSIPVPRTSVTTARLPYPYFHTRTRNTQALRNTILKISGRHVRHDFRATKVRF